MSFNYAQEKIHKQAVCNARLHIFAKVFRMSQDKVLITYLDENGDRQKWNVFISCVKVPKKIDIIQVSLLELVTPCKHKERFCLGMESRAARYQCFLINSIFIILFPSLSITILVILKRAYQYQLGKTSLIYFFIPFYQFIQFSLSLHWAALVWTHEKPSTKQQVE